MAKDNSASYAKIGFIVILGLAAIVATVAYFGGWADGSDEILIETYYNYPVSGLSAGSPITFRGVKVGSVKEVSFVGRYYPAANEADREKIHIVFSVDTDLMGLGRYASAEHSLEQKVKLGLRATVRSNGITGLSRLELDYPRTPHDPAPISWIPRNIMIPPAPSMFENFADSLTRTVNHLNRMNLPALGSNLTEIVESTAKLTSDLDILVVSSAPQINVILENLSAVSASLREFADEIRETPSLLLRSRDNEPLEETR